MGCVGADKVIAVKRVSVLCWVSVSLTLAITRRAIQCEAIIIPYLITYSS